MIEVDWTFLEQFNLFQVAVVILAIWVIFRLLMRFWPFLRKVMDFTSTLGKLAEFMVRTDNTLAEQNETLAEQDVKIDSIHHETHHNNGSSIKDAQKRTEEAVERIELGVKGLYDHVAASDAAAEEMRRDIEDTRPRPEIKQPKE